MSGGSKDAKPASGAKGKSKKPAADEEEEGDVEESKASKKKAPAAKKGAAAAKKAKKEEEEEEEEEEEKPKKKAPAAKKGGAKAKKAAPPAEEEEEEEEEAPKKAAGKKKAAAAAPAAAVAAASASKKPRTGRVALDRGINMNATVYPGHGVMLNQTNISQNNNKFYVIQLLEVGGTYYVWNRWGRVGEDGQNALKGPFGLDAAKKEFAKKFKEKTKNTWSETVRDEFVSHAGKYTLLDMHEDDDDEDEAPAVKKAAVKKVNASSKLAVPVQQFVRQIYSEATGNLTKTIDCVITSKGIKTPLGVLSLAQVEKGDNILFAIQQELEGSKRSSVLAKLSSDYFTNIPHALGRTKPPVIDRIEMFHEKMELSQLMKDMLNVSKDETHGNVLFEDDVDAKYDALGTTISAVERGSTEWKNLLHFISQHKHHADIKNFSDKGDGYDPNAKVSGGTPENVKELEKSIANIFTLERPEEVKRFNKKTGNEHLLFHASRFCNWVGILSRGLLLPDAVTKLGVPRTDFGWLGAGIYFGSEWSTSENYCGVGSDGTGCMLILNVALGKPYEQTEIDGKIRAPPSGHHSIHGNPDLPGSQFQDHEWCVYTNNQHAMRYIVQFNRSSGSWW